MHELPSGDYAPRFMIQRRAAAPRFATFVVLWFLVAAGYASYHIFRTPRDAGSAHPRDTEVTREDTAAWRTGVRQAGSGTLTAHAALRQVEAEVWRTLTLTDSMAERRHLHAALERLAAAREALDRARYDLDSLESSLERGNDR